MYRKFSILFVTAVVLLSGGASGKESPFNVDVFFGWDRCYRPMEWTPVEIGISSTLEEPFEGVVSISAQQDDLNTLNVSHGFVLTPDIPSHLPLVTKFAFAADNCNVVLRSGRGKVVWRNSYNLYDYSEPRRVLTTLNEQDMLIGLVGGRKFGLLRLADDAVSMSHRGRGQVYVKDKTPQMTPWDWPGFVSLDALILYDPDYSLLRPQQLEAIAEWVSNGGRLLVVLGSNQLAADNPIRHLLPFEIGEARQVKLDGSTLEGWGLNGGESEEIVCRGLRAKSEVGICITDGDVDGECFAGVGCVGFGRVAVIGFDPASLTDRQRVKSSRFWVRRLREVVGDSDMMAQSSGSSGREFSTLRRIVLASDAGKDSNQQNNMGRQFETGIAQAGSNAVMEWLHNIEEMRPLSIGWVILILVLLAILLGPVDYLVLKHKGLLPLTWLTSTGWIILFTVGAYYGVEALRGGNMQMRIVSVTDGIGEGDCKWSTAYTGLYAPSSDNYALDGLGEDQWFSGITPTQSRLWAYNRPGATRNIFCVQHDGSNLPSSLPINIWTMQCLLTESPVEKMPFDAKVSREGDEVQVSVVNLSAEPIARGHVLFDNNLGLDFGVVESGRTKEFSGRLRARRNAMQDTLEEYRKRRGYSSYDWRYEDHKAFIAQGSLQRTMAMRDYMAHGAAVVHAEYAGGSTPFSVKDRSCDYNHIQLARLVVFPDEMKEQAK